MDWYSFLYSIFYLSNIQYSLLKNSRVHILKIEYSIIKYLNIKYSTFQYSFNINSSILKDYSMNLKGNWKRIILLGFRYLASSIPLICLTGVAIGVGVLFAFLVISICRNPSIINSLVRWAFIGFSLVEVSGFIGLVYSLLTSYALFDEDYFFSFSQKRIT